MEGIPEGFEIWEKPETGQVLLRKQKLFTDIEVEIIKTELNKNLKENEYKIDCENEKLTIYLSENNYEETDYILSILGMNGIIKSSKLSEILNANAVYQPMMRFTVKIKNNIRSYSVYRYCFKESIDDWYYLDSLDNLQKLAKKYYKHLGKESFYELM
ncbi:MAG TPA: hypothetical protein PLJ38_05320 [bacterium]|nr:hypothetical protein [bacterium]